MAIIFGLIAFFAFIFILIQLYKYERSKDERDIASAGKRGEKIASDVLNCLPEEYCIYENIRVTYNEKTSELDNIVVGPTGIFIVEVKNHKGIISGDYDEKDWLQEKMGRYGGRYDNTLYNPVKQVKTHIYRQVNSETCRQINILSFYEADNTLTKITK